MSDNLGDYQIRFGRHEGDKLKDIPADYLMKLYRDNNVGIRIYKEVGEYILANRERLLKEEAAIKGQLF